MKFRTLCFFSMGSLDEVTGICWLMIFSVGISKTLEHTRDIPGIDHSFYGEHIHSTFQDHCNFHVALAPRQGRALKRKTFWPTLLKRFTMFAQKSNKNTEAWGHLTTNLWFSVKESGTTSRPFRTSSITLVSQTDQVECCNKRGWWFVPGRSQRTQQHQQVPGTDFEVQTDLLIYCTAITLAQSCSQTCSGSFWSARRKQTSTFFTFNVLQLSAAFNFALRLSSQSRRCCWKDRPLRPSRRLNEVWAWFATKVNKVNNFSLPSVSHSCDCSELFFQTRTSTSGT